MRQIIDKVYHGTDAEFTQFVCPAYFVETWKTADYFAKRCRGKGRVMECSVTFENSLAIDLQGQSWGGFFLQDKELQEKCIKYISDGDLDEEAYLCEEGITLGFLADYAINVGYDGIIAYNCMEENDITETQYVVFYPERIAIRKMERETG